MANQVWVSMWTRLPQQGLAVSTTREEPALHVCTRPTWTPLEQAVVFVTDPRLENISQHPHYFEADETHTRVESSQCSYLISERMGSFFVKGILD